MSTFPIERVLVETNADRYGLTGELLSRIPEAPVRQGSEVSGLSLRGRDMGKEVLHLLPYEGEFLKPCPGTKRYICCGYQILNIATNCPMDCSYCILQSYFNQPFLRVFVNLREKLAGVFRTIDDSPERIFRVGTGEFTDSLALDPLIGWSDILLPQFSKRKNAVLELKTKTANIERLLAGRYRDRIIVSWSLNSPYIAQEEEHRSAGLKERLEAARRCQNEGYILGFHLDPLIPHPDWRDGYRRTLDLLDRYVDPNGIIWISLGAFRFMPSLKPIIRERHPGTCVLNGEFITGLDGKMRYFKPLRTDMYAYLRELLEKWYGRRGLYLCMESDEVWQKSMGWSPENSAGLRAYLDQRVEDIFG